MVPLDRRKGDSGPRKAGKEDEMAPPRPPPGNGRGRRGYLGGSSGAVERERALRPPGAERWLRRAGPVSSGSPVSLRASSAFGRCGHALGIEPRGKVYFPVELFRSVPCRDDFFLIQEIPKAMDVFGQYFLFDFRLISPDRVPRRMNTGEGVSLVQSYFLPPKSQGFPLPSPVGGGGRNPGIHRGAGCFTA